MGSGLWVQGSEVPSGPEGTSEPQNESFRRYQILSHKDKIVSSPSERYWLWRFPPLRRANDRIVSNDVIPVKAHGRQLKGFILRINLYNKVDHGPNNSGNTGRGGVYPRPFIVMVVFLKLTPMRARGNPESVWTLWQGYQKFWRSENGLNKKRNTQIAGTINQPHGKGRKRSQAMA